ncbi:MAG TPA: RIP metalloprotease RseP [Vicinamibacterales bacterium]|nr:RIP metalloprotease RseP [Vicinamibacterales bacterium]
MITVLAFLFVLGVLIFVHELGHFLVARFYGVRVLTFSLGFGPKLLKFRRGATEYCLSAIPLGGYVKLAGETVQDQRTGEPDEFLSKSKWVRVQVYLAGPVMNLGLAVVVVAIVLSLGADVPLYQSSPPIIGTVAAGSAGEAAGLKPGDRVVSVDGKRVETWDALAMEYLPKANRELELAVLRGGQTLKIHITPRATGKYEIGEIGIGPILRPQFTQVNPGGPADRAGIRRGDVIVAVEGKRGVPRDAIVERWRRSSGQPVRLTLERDGEEREVTVVPESEGGVGMVRVLVFPYEVKRVDPGPLGALKLSAQQNWDNTVLIVKTLVGLVTRETPVRQLMGPIAIAELSGSAAELGIVELLNLMAMISLNLGLLNLMPVPVLDGGQIAILAWEGLVRRDLSIRAKERILLAGAALIVLLMVTVIYNDISRLMR